MTRLAELGPIASVLGAVNLLQRYARSEDGASAAEYAMILGAIGAVVAIALFMMSGSISVAFGNATGVITQVASTGGEAHPAGGDPTSGDVDTPGGGGGGGTPPVVTPPANNGNNNPNNPNGNNGNGVGTGNGNGGGNGGGNNGNGNGNGGAKPK